MEERGQSRPYKGQHKPLGIGAFRLVSWGYRVQYQCIYVSLVANWTLHLMAVGSAEEPQETCIHPVQGSVAVKPNAQIPLYIRSTNKQT